MLLGALLSPAAAGITHRGLAQERRPTGRVASGRLFRDFGSSESPFRMESSVSSCAVVFKANLRSGRGRKLLGTAFQNDLSVFQE